MMIVLSLQRYSQSHKLVLLCAYVSVSRRDAAVSQLATFCESTGTAQMRLKYEEDISVRMACYTTLRKYIANIVHANNCNINRYYPTKNRI